MVVYAIVFPTLYKLYVGGTSRKSFLRWCKHVDAIENLIEDSPVGSEVIIYLLNRATNEGTTSQDYLKFMIKVCASQSVQLGLKTVLFHLQL